MFTLLGFKRKSETMNRSVTGQEKYSYLLYCIQIHDYLPAN